MKCAFVIPGMLVLICGSALADGPRIIHGSGSDAITLPQREDACQYGFTDYSPGFGIALIPDQQLGMRCAIGPTMITRVGFFCEMGGGSGTLDIVIQENGVELSRTTVAPADGVNEFDIPDAYVVGTPCIMLCPIDFWGATGEDDQSPPYGNCYISNACECGGSSSTCS